MSNRDGLLKGNLDALDESENPFLNSVIDYYCARPDELENLSLCDFAAGYDLVVRGGKRTPSLEERDQYDEDQESERRGNSWFSMQCKLKCFFYLSANVDMSTAFRHFAPEDFALSMSHLFCLKVS